MGYAAIPNHLARGATLSVYAKVVLLVIASRAGKKGTCFPSLATIAKDATVSKSTAQRAIAELTALGIISVAKRSGDRGQSSNLYRVMIDLYDDRPGGLTDHPPVVSQTTKEEPLEEEPSNPPLTSEREAGSVTEPPHFYGSGAVDDPYWAGTGQSPPPNASRASRDQWRRDQQQGVGE